MHTLLLQLVERAASEAGFERVGVAPAVHPEMHELGRFAQWADAGYAGEMEYLKRRNDAGEYKRASLPQALPWAKSVIVAAMNYNPSAPKYTDAAQGTEGWISRYATSLRDYHETVLGALQRVEAALECKIRDEGIDAITRAYVDTGPVLERVYAKYAGIGWVGKNTCIINQELCVCFWRQARSGTRSLW
jgi:epoxyqueuosine reductase